MTLYIETRITPYEGDPRTVSQMLDGLSQAGFVPLISKAKQDFVTNFGLSIPKEPISPEAQMDYFYRRRLYGRVREDLRVPIVGDLFFTPEQKGILYLALMIPESMLQRRSRETKSPLHLEIGLIGKQKDSKYLDALAEAVTRSAEVAGIKSTWNLFVPTSRQFQELCHSKDNKYVSASSLSDDDLKLADILVDQFTRDVAFTIKRSGAILANDLKKQSGKAAKFESTIQHLLQNGLIAQEYVVICKKTSNQVNRVDSIDKVQQMHSLGIMCSCGSAIADEKIEGLFIPTQKLQKLLDQSYWMTVHLVRSFHSVGISEDKILLNLKEGTEEIDAFVDLDGSLVMIELKDNEFSMGHAYPFGGRIGLYKPEIAMIISTKGIASDVKDYFERVKPGAKLLYVDNLRELENNLQDLVVQTRSRRARELLAQFEALATIDVPLREMTVSILGIKPSRADDDL